MIAISIIFHIFVVLIGFNMTTKENINVPGATAILTSYCVETDKPFAEGTSYFTPMKLIKLTKNMFAKVDDLDYNELNQHKWYASKGWNTYYAKRDIIINGKKVCLLMHREIMNTPKGQETDHVDHDGLNCQRHNLRNCTRNQNQMNKTAYGFSKFLGVTHNGKYIRAIIRLTGQRTALHLGYFKTEEQAARAYDAAAKIYHGEFANLNFKDEDEGISRG